METVPQIPITSDSWRIDLRNTAFVTLETHKFVQRPNKKQKDKKILI